MNESVAGSYVEEAPESLIASNPRFFADFTLIIATQVYGAGIVSEGSWASLNAHHSNIGGGGGLGGVLMLIIAAQVCGGEGRT